MSWSWIEKERRDSRSMLKQVKKAIREEFTQLGGYEIVFATCDGELLCCACARKHYKEIVFDHFHNCDTGWKICGITLDCELDPGEGEICMCVNCDKILAENEEDKEE